MRSAKQQGFSLLEIIMVLVIVTVVGALALGSTRQHTRKYQSEAVAQEIALQLLNKKQEAAQSGVAAGLAFPGQGTFVSQGYYEVRGLGTLRIRKARGWVGDYPQTYLAWGAQAGETVSEGSHPLAAMPALPTEDPAILFLPSGEVVTRGIASDGQFHFLRVGSSPTGSGDTLSGLTNAWSLTISADGIVNASATPGFPKGSSNATPVLADLPGAVPHDGSVPRLESLSTIPELGQTSSGALRISGPHNQIQISAAAESPQGDPLFVRWTCDGGQFSHTGEWLPMSYSAEDHLWKASTLWSLPPVPEAEHLVQVQVRDPFGNSTSLSSQSTLDFAVEPEALGVFSMGHGTYSSAGERRARAFRSDGTRSRWVIDYDMAPTRDWMRVSPDGQTVLYSRYHEGFSLFSHTRVFLNFRSLEGESLYSGWLQGDDRLFDRDRFGLIGWNASSTGVFLSRMGSDEIEIEEFTWGTGTYRTLFSIPTTGRPVSIQTSLNLEKILVTSLGSVDYTRDITVYDRATASSSLFFSEDMSIGTLSDHLGTSILSPSGRWIASTHAGGGLRLYDLEAGRTQILAAPVQEFRLLGFSPDERFLLVTGEVGDQTVMRLLKLDGTEVATLEGYLSAVFSPSGEQLVLNRFDGEISIINLTDFQERITRKADGIYRIIQGVTDSLD